MTSPIAALAAVSFVEVDEVFNLASAANPSVCLYPADMTQWQPPTLEPEHGWVPAGWYPDQSGLIRFWDGTRWTGHISPPPPAFMPAQSPGLRLRVAGAFAQLALIATLLVEVVYIKVVWDRLSLVERAVAHPQTVSLADLRGADNQVHSSAIFVIVTYIVAGIVFIAWFYRARVSAERHNPYVPRFGRGWAIGSWITPILGLWRPYQMTTDVLCASELPAGARDSDRHPHALLRVWWFLFIASAISIRFTSSGSPTSVNDFENQSRLLIGSASLRLLAAVLALIVVERITGANDRRRAAILGAPPVV